MSFSTPLALVLLVCIPFVLYLGWPRQHFRRSRDIVSLILRTTITLLLVLAMAGVQLVRSADRLSVMFLVDVSDSMGQAAQESAYEYVRQSLGSMQPDDEAGLILFGANALVERPLSNLRELSAILSTPPTGNTDLEEAIRLAMGILPIDTARRIVILSDGRQTIGSAEAAAELAAATGIEISYAIYTREAAPEVQVTRFEAPSTVSAGQDFDLNISIQSETATPATITILASGEVIKRQTYDLREGTTNLTLPLTGGGSGFKDFQVQVEPVSNDGFYQNNQLSTFSRVIGPPRVLLLSNTPDETQHILPALQQAGLTVDAMSPDQLPIGLVPLAQYDTIIMANISAIALPQDRMEAIRSFVRDLGGGLVAVGGPDAYGPGAYFETPLEEALPLNMQVKDQQRLPQLTIAYVIDRSGSMSAVGLSGVENIELAKEAIIRSIDFLGPNDRAGVVSFDTLGYWIASIQQIGNRLALQRLVASLRTGGGTDILAGMSLVSESIVNDPSDRKHIILLTDGGANPAGLIELSTRLNQDHGVTTSVIAIGDGAAPFLSQMAEAGGGKYHPVSIVEQIPLIFAQETVLATRSYILEESFVPTLSATSPIMNGITSAPPLLGYVATSAKQTAEVILRGPEPYQDPILASWQYGLGRAVAFTSDATARWGANWVGWDQFVRFWDQAVRWTITEGRTGNVETRVVMEGESARLIVDARADDGAFLNGLDLQLSVVDPLSQASLAPLRQVAPGRYEATFNPENEGAYILHVSGRDAGDESLAIDQTTGWVMSYSSEYDLSGSSDGLALLSGLGRLTGGRSLKDDPGLVFAHNLTAQAAATPIWPWFLLLAMLLLPFDIAVRRLIVTRTDLQRLRQFIFGQPRVEATSERISTLFGAKERGRQRAEEAGSTVAGLRARRSQSRANQPSSAARGGAGNDQPSFTPSRKPSPSAPEGNVAGQLLKKRKEREGDKTQ